MTKTLTELPSPRLELKKAIVACGRPAWQIAYLADLTPTILSLIGSGRRTVRPDEAEALAAVLAVDVGDLFPNDYPDREAPE